ncbi:uncharacterized protein LOC114538449 [Dendronephthya gigantea]|uniref:uncharacterized protein LOC114538432 n=1 Tax=Dendronephthya gigantea TaxID=151771 RepID=UPI0010696D1E|nr:uncharacterized protein LOC114538432 [Dendronephthya gigantea]XP_028415425.1 uncharacterized protein LOC114538449 [Dendronephthya gigantea]
MEGFSGDVSFEVNWLPFFLNSSTPDEGVPVLEYLGRKYGPQAAESARSGKGPLSQMAEKMGLKFNYDRMIVNTLKSHCLLDYAKSVSKQNELAEILFNDYFRHAKRIDHSDVLQEAAEACGIDWSAADTHMKNADVMSRVKREAATASASGINGVPHFSIFLKSNQARTQQFSGAQPAATILSVFQKVLSFAKSRV